MPIKRGRLFLAYLLSLLLHALLLSLAFGGAEGLGLPGLTFPWQQRWVEAPSLRVVLQPVRKAAAAPVLMPSAAPVSVPSERVITGPASPPSGSFSSNLRRATTPIVPEALAKAEASTPTDTIAEPADSQAEMPVYATPAPMRHTAVIALEQSDDKTFVVPPPPPEPEPVLETTVSPDAPTLESVVPMPRDTAEFMHHLAEQEVHEQIVDTAQADLEKHEAQQLMDRLAAEKLETQRQEATRQEAARAEAARQEAERQEAERLAAEKLEAQRQEAARQEAARIQEAKEEEERRLARRRAMGRQLDEEAAQRQAAATRQPLPLSLSTARRVRLWGRSDPNVELMLYAENWVRRIQLNTPVDTVRQLAEQRHTAPMVTVAMRSDGSVEAVTLVVSSGVPEVDEAIRRIVQNNVPYPPFPPRLARQYDVVEIRRTWHFDTAIRLD